MSERLIVKQDSVVAHRLWDCQYFSKSCIWSAWSNLSTEYSFSTFIFLDLLCIHISSFSLMFSPCFCDSVILLILLFFCFILCSLIAHFPPFLKIVTFLVQLGVCVLTMYLVIAWQGRQDSVLGQSSWFSSVALVVSSLWTISCASSCISA